MGHPIPAIRLFQNLTLKIQGQGHGWGESSKSQSGCNILSTHIPFVPCQSALPFLRYSIFKIWPWKSKVKVMSEGKVESHNMGPTFYRLTSLSSHVNRPSHSWDTTFSKFDLENPRSMPWLRWKFKVTKWVQLPIVSHPFRSMSIDPPIPEIQHFQNLTLKIQGQGHGWVVNWKSQHGSNILSTHISLIPCQSAIPFLRYDFFKIWPWKSKVKVMGDGNVESHKVGVTSYRFTSLSFHVNRPFHSWDTLFSKFDLENPRSRSWVRGKLKVTTWVQYSINSHLFNSMSIGHPIPEIWLFQNLTLKIQGQGHGWGECWESQSGCNILSIHIHFVPCQSALPFMRYSIFKIWPWNSKVKVKWPWRCTTTGLDNSIELQMG